MLRKVAIVGPESSGKTTLAAYLADYFQGSWVPEYARQYLDKLDRQYGYEDLLTIAKGQVASEKTMLTREKSLLFCDSTMVTMKIWSDDKFGKCDDWIAGQLKEEKYEGYLLCKPDLPWQADPQREDENRRDVLFDSYVEILRRHDKKYKIVEGLGQAREKLAVSHVKLLLSSTP